MFTKHLSKNMFAKHVDMVSKHVYNNYVDTMSKCADDDEGLNHEKSNTGTNHAEAGRNH